MWRVRAIAKANDESSTLADAASMFLEAGHRFDQRFSEARHIG
jgi:hypothetical protein